MRLRPPARFPSPGGFVILFDTRDLVSQNAARGIDFIRGDKPAERRKGRGEAASCRPDPSDLKRLLLLRKYRTGG